MIVARVTSPGHKLGQLIGNFFEGFFSSKLVNLAEEFGLYCDKKELRPKVRGKKKEVIWADNEGNKHKLDYVFEKNGAIDKQGEPVAFIELAWRRYTKHSRNKAGEIEAALVPLGHTYHNTCNLLCAILGGEFTESARKQLMSKNINILHIPYRKIIEAFLIKGIDLDYPEDATKEDKYLLVKAWESLMPDDIKDIEEVFAESISSEYDTFAQLMRNALLKKIEKIRIISLFGDEMVFASANDAITTVEKYDMAHTGKERFYKFEIYVEFTNGSKIECSFRERKETLEFLRIYSDN